MNVADSFLQRLLRKPAPADASSVSQTPRPTPGLLDLLKAAYDRAEQRPEWLPEGAATATIPSYLQGEGPVAGRVASGLRKLYKSYHGTPFGAFEQFKPNAHGIWSAKRKSVADTYRDMSGQLRRGNNDPKTLRLELDMLNPLTVDAGGAWWDNIHPSVLPEELRHVGGRMTTEDILTLADKAGYGGLVVNNVKDANIIPLFSHVRPSRVNTPSTVYGMLDPSRIRILEALGLAGMAGAAAPER